MADYVKWEMGQLIREVERRGIPWPKGEDRNLLAAMLKMDDANERKGQWILALGLFNAATFGILWGFSPAAAPQYGVPLLIGFLATAALLLGAAVTVERVSRIKKSLAKDT